MRRPGLNLLLPGCPSTRAAQHKGPPMRYSIKSTEGGCTFTVKDHHTASDFPVPMMAGDFTALLEGSCKPRW